MALTANEKERLMAARTTEKLAAKTILYTAIVSGQPVQMVSVSGLDIEQASAYCVSIFGNRFEGFRV